jgi:hypothetical protein
MRCPLCRSSLVDRLGRRSTRSALSQCLWVRGGLHNARAGGSHTLTCINHERERDMERLQAAMAAEEEASAAKAKTAMRNRNVLASRVKRIMQVEHADALVVSRPAGGVRRCSGA